MYMYVYMYMYVCVYDSKGCDTINLDQVKFPLFFLQDALSILINKEKYFFFE
jgi:hypothetical protein